jgi:hypothetical protein
MHPRPVLRSIIVFYPIRVSKMASIAKVLYQDRIKPPRQRESCELLAIEANTGQLTHQLQGFQFGLAGISIFCCRHIRICTNQVRQCSR